MGRYGNRNLKLLQIAFERLELSAGRAISEDAPQAGQRQGQRQRMRSREAGTWSCRCIWGNKYLRIRPLSFDSLTSSNTNYSRVAGPVAGPENGCALAIRMLRKTIINKHSSNRRNLFYELLVPSSLDSDFDLFAHGQATDAGQEVRGPGYGVRGRQAQLI